MNKLLQNLLKLQTLEFSDTQDDDAKATIVKLRGKIPAPILGHYDRLRVRGKRGLTAVRNQVCTGCHMRLPLGVIMTLKHDTDIQLCDNCGRYLYLPDEPAGQTGEATPEAKPAKKSRKRKTGVAAA